MAGHPGEPRALRGIHGPLPWEGQWRRPANGGGSKVGGICGDEVTTGSPTPIHVGIAPELAWRPNARSLSERHEGQQRVCGGRILDCLGLQPGLVLHPPHPCLVAKQCGRGCRHKVRGLCGHRRRNWEEAKRSAERTRCDMAPRREGAHAREAVNARPASLRDQNLRLARHECHRRERPPSSICRHRSNGIWSAVRVMVRRWLRPTPSP